MVKFSDIVLNDKIYLYAGIMPHDRCIKIPFIGVCPEFENDNHIQHDLCNEISLLDGTVDIFQSEEVFVNIYKDKLPSILNDIYRILKPGGLLRMSMPDYNCDILNDRALKDDNNEIFFDPGGGGYYDYLNNKVENGGHVWFPTYESTYDILLKSDFDMEKVKFLHYYDNSNNPIIKDIDYNLGYISRTPDNDKRVKNPRRPMSIVIDCCK